MARRRHSGRRRRGSLSFLYKLLSMLVICGAIVAALTLFFRVNTVVVSGQQRYTQQQILAASGIQTGDNLFLLNKYDVANQIIGELPYIETIRINRKLPDTLLVVTRGDENWTGLAEAVARMELPNRDALLEIIRSDEDPDRREARLKQADANAYALLLRTVYPALRKNTFRISYISRERTPQEARRLAEEQPGELNAYEFYTVARTYCANDSAAYGNLLLKAADTYPDNAEANNNAARICLTRGDLEAARKYLDRTNNEPFTWNNRGVLLWMQGRREEALFWLRKAADEGDPQARENLKEIDQLMKNDE